MEVGRLHGFRESEEYSALIDSYVDGRPWISKPER